MTRLTALAPRRSSGRAVDHLAGLAAALADAPDAEGCLRALLVHAARATQAASGRIAAAGRVTVVLDPTAPGGARRAGDADQGPLPASPRTLRALPVGTAGAHLELAVAPQVRDADGTLSACVAVTAAVLAAVERAEEASRHVGADALTELDNATSFERALRREVANANRRGEALSVVLVDIDGLGARNAAGGRAAGDRVLGGVAAALTSVTRDMDLVARTAGDEFAMLLPACSSVGALRVLRRLAATLSERADVADATVSTGVATLGEHADDAVELLGAARGALAKASATGAAGIEVAPRRLRLETEAEPEPVAGGLPSRRR